MADLSPVAGGAAMTTSAEAMVVRALTRAAISAACARALPTPEAQP